MLIQLLDHLAHGFRVRGGGVLVGNSEKAANGHYSTPLFNDAHLF